jgi:hypothetical protein
MKMKTKINLYELIEASASAALPLQSQNGAMPPGHNGPWNDVETPMRNTGHWLITFAKAYRISGKQKYLDAVDLAVEYLISEELRPGGAAFWHREEARKDASNGLIGQAWTIESLAIAADVLNRPHLTKLAEEVFLLHPFDESLCLWSTINVDGSPGKLMRTINQQIWFAAAGSMIADRSPTSEKVLTRVDGFVHRFLDYLSFNRHGIIKHVFNPYSFSRRFASFLHKVRRRSAHQKRSRELAIGYHTFNLYGLALLKLIYPQNPMFTDKKLEPIWKTINSFEFNELAKNNPYAYFYNPSGIEIAFALSVFRPDSNDLKDEYLAMQFAKSYNFDTNLLDQGVKGTSTTLTARIYEATRLSDCTLYL